MTADANTKQLQRGPVVQLGRHQVPEDWPVKGERCSRFKERLRNGFFSTYMAGDVIIDVGYRGCTAVPIFPHAIGMNLDFAGCDGFALPFPDDIADAIYSSGILEHIADYKSAIRDWYRVVKPGGFIICCVSQYAKEIALPSSWSADDKRCYTPASLLREFEEALEPNTYRIGHLRDCDNGHTEGAESECHAGSYEIELVVEKMKKRQRSLGGGAEATILEPDVVSAGKSYHVIPDPDLVTARRERRICGGQLDVGAPYRIVQERNDLVLARFQLLRERDELAGECAAISRDRDRLAEEDGHLTAEVMQLAAAVWVAMHEGVQSTRDCEALVSELLQMVRGNEALVGDRDQLVHKLGQAIDERDTIASALLLAVNDADELAGECAAISRDRDRLAEEYGHLTVEAMQLAAAVWAATHEGVQSIRDCEALASELLQMVRGNEALAGDRDQLVHKLGQAIDDRDTIAAALLLAINDADELAARRDRSFYRRLRRWLLESSTTRRRKKADPSTQLNLT
jgi:cell division protein ZapA (FtsZ GTPase activity inhibitor)